MAIEIERKYLVTSDAWRESAEEGIRYVQGYMPTENGTTLRIRIAGPAAYLTIKGRRTGISREEFEYPIPLADAEELLKLCRQPYIDKHRYIVNYAGDRWEVDVFAGLNEGLVMAELEIPSEDYSFEIPEWVGDDVSTEFRYTNVQLSLNPFTEWEH